MSEREMKQVQLKNLDYTRGGETGDIGLRRKALEKKR